MNDFVTKILPVLLIAVAGFILRQTKVLNKNSGDTFLKLAYYFAVPALILLSVTEIKLSADFILLPVCSTIIILSSWGLSTLFLRFFKLERKSQGVFLIGSMILNIGFLLPFIIAYYGQEGLVRILMCDFTNAFLIYTLIYYIAVRHGSKSGNKKTLYRKFLYSPPLWALVLSVVLNQTGFHFSGTTASFLHHAGDMTIPLYMLGLGTLFDPKIVKLMPSVAVIGLRMAGGLALGFLLVVIFGLEGLSRTIVIICSAAPVGYNTLTFSSLEELDTEFAASLLSISILLGIVFIPVLIYLLK